MTEKEALEIAEPAVKAVVDCIAGGLFGQITDYAEFGEGFSLDSLVNAVNAFKKDAHISHFDQYETLSRSADQIDVYIYQNGSGFAVDYGFTTDGAGNDLTLQMSFLLCGNGLFKAVIEDCHVL